jgi:hypothetical protein
VIVSFLETLALITLGSCIGYLVQCSGYLSIILSDMLDCL